MSVAIATMVLQVTGLYLGAGLVFAIVFVGVGVSRVDSASHGAPLGFRLVILPGATLLWPLLGWRWMRAGRDTGAAR